jgi:3-(3-hydroxy-phenyl)propionate hydroxylase
MADRSVVVVGAGSVGLVTALGLAQSGIEVTVLEDGPGPVAAPRDNIYHWSVLPELERLGLLPEMVAAGMLNTRWSHRVRRTGEIIVFDMSLLADELAHPFNLHLNQAAMTSLLLEHIARLPGTRVEWDTTVTALAQDDGGVTVMGRGPDGARSYRAGWVIGADGARSVVRRELGLALAGSTWPDRFVATDIRYDFSTLGCESAGFNVDNQHGAIIAREAESGLWRYIFSESRLLPEQTASERVVPHLAAVLPGGASIEVVQSFPYRIHQRSVERMRSGRMILVGDAAHLTNPTGGCGMTSGLFDAVAATEALAAVVNDGVSPDLLDRYSEVRRRNFLDFASPYSAELKEFIFNTEDDAKFAAEVAYYRDVAADPDRARDYLRMTGGCRTPSVLSAAVNEY